MSMMPNLPPEVIRAILAGEPPPEAPPTAPTYVPPTVLSAPAPGFRERLANSLAGIQSGPAGMPGESAGSAFTRNLLTGGAQGYARVGAKKAERAATTLAATNSANRAEADRNYENARDTWRARLSTYYRTKADQNGKVLVTRQMGTDMGNTAAVGTYMDPGDIGDRISKVRGQATVPAELAPTMGMEPGARVDPGRVLEARRLTKRPSPKPTKTPSPTEGRRKVVVGIVSDLMRAGRKTRASVQEYLNQPGVYATLARNGLTPKTILAEFPE